MRAYKGLIKRFLIVTCSVGLCAKNRLNVNGMEQFILLTDWRADAHKDRQCYRMEYSRELSAQQIYHFNRVGLFLSFLVFNGMSAKRREKVPSRRIVAKSVFGGALSKIRVKIFDVHPADAYVLIRFLK
jgi:hypothetical protein